MADIRLEKMGVGRYAVYVDGVKLRDVMRVQHDLTPTNALAEFTVTFSVGKFEIVPNVGEMALFGLKPSDY
jgi:hypothetical protein